MIHPSGSLAANDVSVQCRVRRSETVSNPSFDDFVDMTCTMRNWKPTSMRSSMAVSNLSDGPELLLRPLARLTMTEMPEHSSSTPSSEPNKSDSESRNSSRTGASSGQYSVSRGGSGSSTRPASALRSVSSGSRRSCSRSRRRVWSDMYEDYKEIEPEEKKDVLPYSIPLSAIVVVDASRHILYITTSKTGYFEFTFSTQNAHDVLLAFLSNSLEAERITYSDPAKSLVQDDETASFDVEALTATRLKETVKSESMGQKLRRKMVFIASRISEISSLSECGFCEYNNAVASPDRGYATLYSGDKMSTQKMNYVNDQSKCNLLSELELETASCL